MAPSPGRRPGERRTDARRGVRDLEVEFYAEDKVTIAGLSGPDRVAKRESELAKWAAIGRQIADAMGRGDEEAREEDEANCRVVTCKNTMVKSEDQVREKKLRNGMRKGHEIGEGLFSASAQTTERRRRYRESRERVGRLLERRDRWEASKNKELYVCGIENEMQRYRSGARQMDERAEEEKKELVEKGVEMVKALDKRPSLRWAGKLNSRMRAYRKLKRERSFAEAREAVRMSCVVEKREEVRMEIARRRTEEERKERRRKARESRIDRKERRKELMVQCRQTYEEWLWKGLEDDLLRQIELRDALKDLTRKHLGEIDTEEVGKEKIVLRLELNEFFNLSIREADEIVVGLNRGNKYRHALRNEMTSIVRNISDKGVISEQIQQSTAPGTSRRVTQTGIGSRSQRAREIGKNLADEVRDMEERCKLQRGEQDEKKGRKEQRRRELVLLWEAPPVGPPVGDEEIFLFFLLFCF